MKRKNFFLTLLIFTTIGSLFYSYNLNKRLQAIESRFGGARKLSCSKDNVQSELKNKVVRVIGTYGEGSGFPINENEMVTSFHVIDGEDSPKVVLANGDILTPLSIRGSSILDIAIMKFEDTHFNPMQFYGFYGNADTPSLTTFDEPVYAGGYAFGSKLSGDVTITKGSYGGERYLKEFESSIINTDISLKGGMSGGPLVDSCAQVIGVNTAGVAGLSMFISMRDIQASWGEYNDSEIAKIDIDLTTSEGVVNAFYTYIRARNLQKAYELVSPARLEGKTFEEWQQGYSQTLYVMVIDTKVDEDDENKVWVKLRTGDWVDGELVNQYFEGYWIVTPSSVIPSQAEGSTFLLGESNIKLLDEEPPYSWFFYWEEE